MQQGYRERVGTVMAEASKPMQRTLAPVASHKAVTDCLTRGGVAPVLE